MAAALPNWNPTAKSCATRTPIRRRSMPLHDHAGLYVPSYMLRLDLDSDDATQLWHQLKDDLDIPDTAEVFTRRGRHVYLQLPSGITFHQATGVHPDFDVMSGPGTRSPRAR